MKRILLTIVLSIFFIALKAQTSYQLTVCGSIVSPFSGMYTNTITMTIAQGGIVNTYTTTLTGSPQFCFQPATVICNAGPTAVYTISLAIDSCPPSLVFSDTLISNDSYTVSLNPCSLPCNATITNSNTPNGGITLTANPNGNGVYTYVWSNGATTQSISANTNSMYSVAITDQYGNVCTASTNVAACSVNINNSGAISGTNTVNLTAIATGAQPITYSWSNNQTTQSITGNAGSSYCVYITDANGCTSVDCDTVSVGCNLSVSINASFAGGGMLTATAASGGVPIASYSWTLNGIAYPSTNSYVFYNQPGLYCVTVVDINGCSGTNCYNYTGTGCNLSTSLSSFIPPNVPPNTVMGLLASTTGGTSPYYYSWFLNGVMLPDSTPNITVSQTGLYTVNVVDVNGCSAIDTMQLNLSGLGNCSVTVTDTITWNTHILIANSNGVWPFTYSWTHNNNFVDTTSSIIVQAGGTYMVTITDASGCVSSFTYFLSQGCIDNTSLNVPLNGAPVTITASSNGVLPLSYNWTLNGLPFSTQATITTTINGTYCYTVTDSLGCSVSNCYTYNTSPLGGCDAFFTTVFDSLYLPSSNNIMVDFTSYPNGLPPFTYSWVFSDGSTSNLSNPQHVFYYSNFADMMWAWASLTITDATGCTSTYNNSVPMPPYNYGCSAMFNFSSNYNTSTTGLVNFNNLSSTQDTGSTYLWVFSDSTYSFDQNPSHVFQTSGVFYVCLTVTNSNGCSASYCESVYIDLSWWNNNNPYNNPCTAGYILIPNNNTPGTVLIVDISQVNNPSYVWNTSNGFMTNSPNPFFNLTGPGNFTLCATVTDTLTGCADTFCDSLSIDSLGNVFKVGSNVFLTSDATVGFIVVSAPRNSNTTSINEGNVASAFNFWPNPANSMIELSMKPLNEASSLSVYDLTGALVLEQKINANTSIFKTDISNLSNGSYLIKLSDSKNSSLSKLIVNH
jgi:hypothetical protein